jgi:hypothetical protein
LPQPAVKAMTAPAAKAKTRRLKLPPKSCNLPTFYGLRHHRRRRQRHPYGA